MKKVITLLLALSLVFALAACGGKDDPKPSGGGTLGNREDNTSSQGEPAPPDEGDIPEMPDGGLSESKVEIKGDAVVQTTPMVGGGTQTVEYIFDGDQLKTVKLTSVGTVEVDEATFNALKDALTEQGYSEFEKKGRTITSICTDPENAAAFSYYATYNKENLKALLEGAVTGDMSGGAGGGTAVGETTVNTAWSDLSLPDGFPKLADGVTEYTQLGDGMFSISWDAMSEADADAMAEKLETWTGGTFELMEDSGVKNWFLDTGKHNVTLTYYADTFSGTMPQLLLNVSIWE